SGDSRSGSSTALAPDGFGKRVRPARAVYPGRYAILNATPPATVRRLHRRRATGYKLLGEADRSRSVSHQWVPHLLLVRRFWVWSMPLSLGCSFRFVIYRSNMPLSQSDT